MNYLRKSLSIFGVIGNLYAYGSDIPSQEKEKRNFTVSHTSGNFFENPSLAPIVFSLLNSMTPKEKLNFACVNKNLREKVYVSFKALPLNTFVLSVQRMLYLEGEKEAETRTLKYFSDIDPRLFHICKLKFLGPRGKKDGTDFFSKLLSVNPHVKSLSNEGWNCYEGPNLDALFRLKELEWLELRQGGYMQPAALRKIDFFKTLLRPLTQLNHLSIAELSINDAAAHINLDHIKEIKFFYSCMPKGLCPALTNLQNLKWFGVGDVFQSDFPCMDKMTRLHLENFKHIDDRIYKDLELLEDLTLCEMGLITGEHLGTLASLTSFKSRNCKIFDFSNVLKLPVTLKKLSVTYKAPWKVPTKTLTHLTDLKSLEIGNVVLEDDSPLDVPALRQLTIAPKSFPCDFKKILPVTVRHFDIDTHYLGGIRTRRVYGEQLDKLMSEKRSILKALLIVPGLKETLTSLTLFDFKINESLDLSHLTALKELSFRKCSIEEKYFPKLPSGLKKLAMNKTDVSTSTLDVFRTFLVNSGARVVLKRLAFTIDGLCCPTVSFYI